MRCSRYLPKLGFTKNGFVSHRSIKEVVSVSRSSCGSQGYGKRDCEERNEVMKPHGYKGDRHRSPPFYSYAIRNPLQKPFEPYDPFLSRRVTFNLGISLVTLIERRECVLSGSVGNK